MFLNELKNKIEVEKFDFLDEAFKEAFYDCKKNNLKNSCVLFSPACASFDQFKNFEHRGNHFKELVLNFCKK